MLICVLQENIAANIKLTSDHSIEAEIFVRNTTQLIVTMIVYGVDQLNVPTYFQPILVPKFLIHEDANTSKLSIGMRQENDQLVFYRTQSTKPTATLTNHSMEFDIDIDQIITCISFSVNVSYYNILN